jgi:hypothetical protein
MLTLPRFLTTKWAKIWRYGLLLIFVYIIVDIFCIPFYWSSQYKPQVGDFIFESLIPIELVRTIEGTTNSEFSHVGIVKQKNDGSWVVVEAMDGVEETPLWQYIAQSRWDHFAVYRLRPEYRGFIPAFMKEIEKYYGRPYDYRYAMDDASIYCSELPYKAFKSVSGRELGALKTLGQLNWKPYESTIRKLDGGSLPLDRVMITPVDLSKAPELELILNVGYSNLNK